MKIRNKGKFYISFDSIDEDINKIAEVLSKMQFVPLKVEALYGEDRFGYSGYSPLFEEVPTGEMMPFYDVLVNDFVIDTTVSVRRS